MGDGERKKVALILLNMGGPDTLSAIRPFLFNLFRDRDIIKFPGGPVPQFLFAYIVSGIRTRKVRPMYESIGGGSPLNRITETQAVLLKQALNDEGKHIFSVHIAMRYWYPFTKHAVVEAMERSPSAIVALPLYPHYSRATTGSSFNELERALAREKVQAPLIKVENYFDHSGYIESVAGSLSASLEQAEGDKTAIIFSAHGLPRSLIEGGDPYLSHIEKSVSLVMEKFPGYSHFLSFQSRAGRDWLSPDTDQVIRECAEQGFQTIVMVPISFVSDHIETLYEIDILYREMAEELGLTFLRSSSLNDSRLFINALKDIVFQKLETVSFGRER